MQPGTRGSGNVDDEFGERVAPYLRELHVHCYHLLGSLSDADDLLQETLFAAWRSRSGFRGDATMRTWLYRIATNRCLNAIRDGRRRAPTVPIPPFPPPEPNGRTEVSWLQPYPDGGSATVQLGLADDPAVRYETGESVELAFVIALQRLPPRQTAALVLGDVLGFSLAEIGDLLDVTPTSAKGLLQRARAGVGRVRDTSKGHSRADDHALATAFGRALTAGDIAGLLALLTDDAWLAMPPAPHLYVGPAAVEGFLRASEAWRGPRPVRLVAVRANGQPGFAHYLGSPGSVVADATGVVMVATRGKAISSIVRFLDPSLPQRFGLSSSVPVRAPMSIRG